jgi:predicted amidohydrolase
MAWAIAEKRTDYRERPLKIGVIQLAEFSLEVAERFVRQAAEDRPDVVVLPEIGCGQEPQDLERSAIVQTMQDYARRGRMHVVLNVIEANGARTFNTTLILGRDGTVVGRYRKVHIPLPIERDRKQDGGDGFPVFDLDFGRVGIEVCFDNYFPESVRCLALQGAEIIFFPHQEHYCWNEVEHIGILSRARAIENVLYMVPCGPTAAEDGPFGRTAVIDPTGKYVLQLPPREEGYGSTIVDLGLIERVRIDMPREKEPPSMRTQMLVDRSERPLWGRRRPEVYSL